MKSIHILEMIFAQTDQAGPLWLLLESALDSVWVRLAALAFLLCAIVAALALAIRRKT
jgi:hypothetical protein